VALCRVQPDNQEPSPPVELFRSQDVDRYFGRFSPDGRWIAFVSEESGQSEVYVCSFESDGTVGLPVSVSNGNGNNPRWSREGKRLYFLADQKGLMSVDVTTQPTFNVSTPKLVLDLETQERFAFRYDTLPGDRLLIILRGEQEGEITRYNVVLDWLDELKVKMSAQMARR
jgi:hypothetical protein